MSNNMFQYVHETNHRFTLNNAKILCSEKNLKIHRSNTFQDEYKFHQQSYGKYDVSYVVSELARFARGRIEDSNLTGSHSTALNGSRSHVSRTTYLGRRCKPHVQLDFAEVRIECR